MRLTINLATRRYVNTRLINALLALAFVLAIGLLILRVRETAYNQIELAQLKKLLAGAGKPAAGPAVSEAQLKAMQSRVRFANTLIERKSVNWLALLDGLEEVLPAGVALTQIEPSQGDAVTLTGVATGFSGIRALLENMEQSKKFSEVYLMSQSDTKVGLTQRGITFTVSCKVAYR